MTLPPSVLMMVLLMGTGSRYGFHGDELYFRMLPLRWWYTDQPPLTVWLTHAAMLLGHTVWVQRLPAVVAAGVGVVVAGLTPRRLGYSLASQRVAAWAHATTVYPLLVGHVFLTASLDLVAWQVVVLLVLEAVRGRTRALGWAGVVAGVACWNKLLVLGLVAALTAAVALVHPRVVRSRAAVVAAAALLVLGGPQVAVQLWHGLPMRHVSAALIAHHGATNRLLVVPMLVVFLGPPYFGVWWSGLRWRSGQERWSIPLLVVSGGLLLGWTLLWPAQPYYPVAAFLPALSIGWGVMGGAPSRMWRRRWCVVAGNTVVSAVVCLPVLPAGSAAFDVVTRINPMARDQTGWAEAVEQVAQARGGGGVSVITDSYALAGALAEGGTAFGIGRDLVHSGDNALWELGPPKTSTVLLVGNHAVARSNLFQYCTPAGSLQAGISDPFQLRGTPMARCEGPLGGWAAVWSSLRTYGT